MDLQQKTLRRYRQFFPKETFREISKRTGINITRVYRLFHGRTMNVEEFEIFEKAISHRISESPNFCQFTKMMEDASAVLTNEELGKLTEYITRKLKARTYSRLYIKASYADAIIA
jgi:hypothetical protein